MVVTGKKIVAVLGATGMQGGSVVRTLLKDHSDKWSVRALTRNPDSPNAQALAKQGVQVVACDLNDKASLQRAFTGAYAVFAVTNFWDMDMLQSKGPTFEIEQGKNIEVAAKAAGIQHLIWSSLDNVTKRTNGKYKHVYHFTNKAVIEERLLASGLPVSVYVAGVYMSNFIKYPQLRPVKVTDSLCQIEVPIHADIAVPMVDIEHDTGLFVADILARRDELLGKRVYGYNSYMTYKEVMDQIGEFTGKTIEYKYTPIPAAALHSMSMVQRDLAEMMLFFGEHSYYDSEEASKQQRMPAGLSTFKSYLEREMPTV
ncbi:hypothetical protein RI367_003415 [Sorochytrium milnesiophthora]